MLSLIHILQFSDGSTCEASLKKQDKNSHLAVFGVRRNLISESTWDEIKTAALGNSNIVAEGDPVIAQMCIRDRPLIEVSGERKS